jgi:conjugal transfer/entry exclusion protein
MKQLKFLIPIFAICLFLGTSKANAQWTVIDPSNIAQSIVNNSKSLVQESQTATHMVKNCAPV